MSQPPKPSRSAGTARLAGSRIPVTPRGVHPLYEKEIHALVDQDLTPALTPYFCDFWAPLLAPVQQCIIRELRLLAWRAARQPPRSVEEVKGLSQDELARRIGLRDRGAIGRAFRPPRNGPDYFGQFVSRQRQRWADPRTGQVKRGADVYIVRMRDPRSPLDEPVLVQRQAERVLREGESLLGDQIAMGQDAPHPGDLPVTVGGSGKRHPAPQAGDVPVTWAGSVPQNPPAISGRIAPQHVVVVDDSKSSLLHDLTDALVREQVWPDEARQIVEEIPAGEIRAWLDYLPHHPTPIRNRGAFLREVLRKRRPPPAVPGSSGAVPAAQPRGTMPGQDVAKRDEWIKATFTACSRSEQRALWARAEAEVRREFEQAWSNLGLAGRRAPEGAVWAAVGRLLEEREGGPGSAGARARPGGADAAGLAPLPSPTLPDARRFLAWVQVDQGIDVCERGRSRTVSAARRKVWLILSDWGLPLRVIAGLCGVDHAAVVRGLKMIRARRRDRAEARGWAERFRVMLGVMAR